MFSLSEKILQSNAFISGQSTGYADLVPTDTVDMISVTLQPHGAKAFFAMPISELFEKTVPLGDLSDPALNELQDRLMNTPDTAMCVQLIEIFLLKRLQITKDYNYRRMTAVLNAIHYGQANVDNLAQTSCLGYKQFKRIFAEYAGINPKDFVRIVRFQRALFIWQHQPGISFTHLAYESGFCDQSHLIKEFITFSGYTPSEYKAVCAPYSDYFS
ncbi:AraC family transcriptional regulator [Bacteroidia bacterium]|nr:AraC family transcriptional regulator [Bacteroidia bacterium]